ncbi:MAG: tetratricopeptide repeat protein [Rhodospirillaceae bacterium]
MARQNLPPPQPINDAVALHRAGRLAEAIEAYRKILKKTPREPNALHLLGVALMQHGDLREGLVWITKAVTVRDDFPDAHSNAVVIAGQLGDFKLAEHHARKAAHYKKNATTYNTLGQILRTLGRYDEAVAAFRAAHENNPRDINGCVSYARGLRITDNFTEMLRVAEEGLRLAPDHPTLQLLASEAHFGLAHYQAGWRAYRYRFQSLENRIPPKTYALPTWQGEDLTGRTLLIWAEQGPGDEMMYANMYADAIARAGRCVIQCSPRLAPVIKRSFPSVEIFDRDLTTEELAKIDVQTAAASLGEWLRPSLESFPRTAAYLKADADLRERLRTKYLADNKGGVLIGIAWRSANTYGAAEKSLNVLDWGPILKVPGATFVNLQYGDTAADRENASRGFGVPIIHDADIDPLKDMDGFTAQVAAMDLVISSSNTAAHVAGALGVPTICMLPLSLDHGRRWYWLAHGDRTPWYPAHRLLKQKQPSEWLDVILQAGLMVIAITRPDSAEAAVYYRSMISGFASMKRPRDAEAVCEHMARDPTLAAEAYLNIAELRRAELDAEGVFTACEKAIAANPAYWEAHNLKGVVLADLHRFEEAIAVYRQALAYNDKSHIVHSNLGKALHHLGRNADAIHHHKLAFESAPPEKTSARDAIALNYAAALNDDGQHARALALIDDLVTRNPDHADMRHNRSLMLLAQERWTEGWQEFGWRLKRQNAPVYYKYFPHIKQWAGESLANKKVLIWTEHGIGDEILAATMLPDLVAIARKVVILCSGRLVPLFRRSFPGVQAEELKAPVHQIAMAKDFDYQAAMWDLGIAFRQTAADFPPRARTLIADPQRSASLRKRYTSAAPGNLLVGISWASPINQEMGWLKASQLEAWRPILQTPGVTFVNLQYGDQRPALARIRETFGVEILNDESIDPLKDMDAFAAQVSAMDLVISTSNTLVHTAGALGVPTWVLLATGRGQIWYWLHGRTDSPWYSSVRLIRQEKPSDWTQPIAQCAKDLRELIQAKKESGRS